MHHTMTWKMHLLTWWTMNLRRSRKVDHQMRLTMMWDDAEHVLQLKGKERWGKRMWWQKWRRRIRLQRQIRFQWQKKGDKTIATARVAPHEEVLPRKSTSQSSSLPHPPQVLEDKRSSMPREVVE